MEGSTFLESNFHYTLGGSVEFSNGELYLLTDETTKLKIKQAPKEIPLSVQTQASYSQVVSFGSIPFLHVSYFKWV